jgi:predicted ATPase
LKKIILTGGLGVGKTSIIRALCQKNYDVRDEVFTHLFALAQREGCFNDELLHSKKIIHDLVCAQIELEKKPVRGSLLFLDRSKIDIWGFSKNMGITPFDVDQKELLNCDCDLFFIISPMPRKYDDQNAIRRQTYEESLEHHALIAQHYREFIGRQNRNVDECLIEVVLSY